MKGEWQVSFNVTVDYRRDSYLSEFSKKTLQDRYMIDGEVSPQDAFARAAKAFANDEEHAQRLYDYASSSGLCLVLLYYLMVEPPVAFLLAAFLISWRTAEKGLQITTQRMLFSVALAGVLVVAGIVYEAWEVKHLTVLKALE